MTQTLEQLVVEIKAEVGGLRRELRVAEGAVAASARKMDRDVREIASGFGRIGASVKTLAGGIGVALGAAGIAGLVSSLASATRGAIENAGALADLSARAGVTAEKYQELRFSIEQAGGEVAALDAGLTTFGRNLSNLDRGTGSLATFLAKADPAFAETLKGASGTGEAIDLLADRIKALTSEQDRLALAQAALGRGGREFVLALASGSDGLAEYARQARETGGVIANDLVKRGDDLADAIGRISGVVKAEFTSAVLGAEGGAEDLLDTISDPETIKRIGELAANVGELASFLLELAAAAGRAVGAVGAALEANTTGSRAARDFARFDRLIAEQAKGGPVLTDDQVAQLAPAGVGTRVVLGAAERAALGVAPPKSASSTLGNYDTGKTKSGGTKGTKSAGRDPLESVLATLRAEESAAEKIAEERKRFEESVTRDLESATLTRAELIRREADRRIEELERLGFAEERAAELRVEIEETAAAEIEQTREESASSLAKFAEVGVETVADFLSGALLEETDASFDELVASFAKTLLRMEIAAAATSIGSILSEKIKAAGASSSAGGGAAGAASNVGGSILTAILGRVVGFADGGVVTGPTLGLIGEDPATRPEVVMPLDRFRELRGGGAGAGIEVVNAVPGVRAKARRAPGRNGRDRYLVELESAFGTLLARGAFRDQIGGRHAPGQR